MMESSNMPSDASRMAPIDVDRDSEETLSSDSDVEMEGDAEFVIAPASSRHAASKTAPLSSPPQPSTTSTLGRREGASARGNLLSEAAQRMEERAVSGGGNASVNGKSYGKKRRLSPSPSPSPSSSPSSATRKPSSQPRASVLDFRLPSRTPPRKQHQSMSFERDEESKGESSSTSVAKSDLANRIVATRTWICGEWYGKCVLRFHNVYVQLQLWTLPAADGATTLAFNNSVTCRQLNRFSLSSGDAPYFAILQLERVGAGPKFGEFCDSCFARAAEKDEPSIELNIYGAVLFFEEELDIVRCRSLGDLSKVLGALLDVSVTDEEAAQIRRLGEPLKTSQGADRSNRSPPTKLRQGKLSFEKTAAESAHSEESTMSSRFRTSSRRQSALQQRSPRDVEVVVPLSNETDPDAGEPEKEESKTDSSGGERRSTRAGTRSQRQQLQVDTDRLRSERRSTMVLTYPFDDTDRPGQITLTYGDIDRLRPGEFLNDSLIDFYLRYLWRQMESWQRDQVYFFSSHFFTQLSGGKLSGTVSLSDDRLRRISRWTHKENLFEKRFLCIPINDSCHWSIVVLCNLSSAIIHKRKRNQKNPATSNNIKCVDLVHEGDEKATVIDTTEEASDSEEEEGMQKERMLHPPCMLFLDSLQCHPKKKICTLLKRYLEYEFKRRTGNSNGEGNPSEAIETSTAATFDAESIKMIEPEVPLQSNSSDCGVFLLMYTAQILQRFPTGLSHEDVMTKLSASVSKTMFNQGHVQEFRDYLHQLIFTLSKIKRRGDNEHSVRAEGLDFFAIES